MKADGTLHNIVSQTGVELSGGQSVVWSGITSDPTTASAGDHRQKSLENALELCGADCEGAKAAGEYKSKYQQ